MPAGVDFRSHQLKDMRPCDVFLVFVSQETDASDFQNAEIGSARFCQTYVDGKTLIPALIDAVDPPRPMANLDYVVLSHRDVDAAATQIEKEIGSARRIRLFISHAHRDADIAARLVDVIGANMEVPESELRCTSVAGYQLDLGRWRRTYYAASSARHCASSRFSPQQPRQRLGPVRARRRLGECRNVDSIARGRTRGQGHSGTAARRAGGQLNVPGTVDGCWISCSERSAGRPGPAWSVRTSATNSSNTWSQDFRSGSVRRRAQGASRPSGPASARGRAACSTI